MISISALPRLPLRGTSNARGNQKLLLMSSIVLLCALIPVQPTHASTDGKIHRTSIEGWYPAERMCELDVRDIAQGRPWACTRSADRSGWELRITARNGEPQ